jgi:hypothetical protein
VDGGPTLNPSTFEILAGIHEVAASEVVVLPNSGNVILAAERAAELSEKDVAVVDSRWPQAGLACLLQHDPDAGLEENRTMRWRSRTSRRGRRPRARDDCQVRLPRRRRRVSGRADVVWGEPRDPAGVLERLAPGHELITCVSGADAPLDHDAIAALEPPGVELELHDGGQPHYWWLLAAE